MNLGLATAKRRAQDRSAWRKLVATATSSQTRSWRRRINAVIALSSRLKQNILPALMMLRSNNYEVQQAETVKNNAFEAIIGPTYRLCYKTTEACV